MNPDALTTDNVLLQKEQTIRYNSRNRVESFSLDDDSLVFAYRPDTTKWRTQYYEDGQLKYTKYHFFSETLFMQGTQQKQLVELIPTDSVGRQPRKVCVRQWDCQKFILYLSPSFSKSTNKVQWF